MPSFSLADALTHYREVANATHRFWSYFQEIAIARKLKSELDWGDVSSAVFEAILELLKWTLLGIFSGISYIAWLLLELAVANQKKLKEPNALGAVGFSVLVFLLGALALKKPGAS